ncbi:MAG: hypothetical protein PHC50_03455 [Candidatus Cloacimonetes bacterium]|nr:hypothetical protein [Candidatus Cloacimonadota bacterium]
MAKGIITCPICQGSGKITENQEEYEFLHRDPITSRCLVCDGSGKIGVRKKLPDGRPARSLVGNKLNVSAKRKSAHSSQAAADLHPCNRQMIITDIEELPSLGGSDPIYTEGLLISPEHPCFHEMLSFFRKTAQRAGIWSDARERLYIQYLERTISELKEANNG